MLRPNSPSKLTEVVIMDVHQLPINAAGERERGRRSCDMSAGPFAPSRASMSGTVRAQAHSPGQSIPIPTAADEGTTRRLLGKLHWVRHGARYVDFLVYEPDSQKEPLRAGLSF